MQQLLFCRRQFLTAKIPFLEPNFRRLLRKNSAHDAIAVRRDPPLLASIMQKGLNSISADEKISIKKSGTPISNALMNIKI
jgi:hypothetical protein